MFRYLWAMQFAYNKTVLDAGCGSGYGSDLLAAVARKVVAVDYDSEAVVQNRVNYAYRNNLTFSVKDVADLSLPDQSFDLIVSFEVYEHLDAVRSELFLKHLRRLCRPSGRVLLSTPNRLVEAPFMRSAGQSYRYHVNSVSPAEFKARLGAHFKSVRLFGQRVKGPWLKGMLKALDPLNLRHRSFSYDTKQRLDRALSQRGFGANPELCSIRLARSLVRQSGIIVAVCKT